MLGFTLGFRAPSHLQIKLFSEVYDGTVNIQPVPVANHDSDHIIISNSSHMFIVK